MANVIEVLLRARNLTGPALGTFRRDVDRTTSTLRGLRSIVGATVGTVGFAQLARSAVNASDSISNLRSKIRLVTMDELELAKVQEQIADIAKNTRTQLEAVGELFTRVARSTRELGATQAQALKFTESVTQAIQISGNTAQEASAGVIQLSQALSSGTLRGDELRSVLEQMPRVASAIADGLGTTVGQLRKLGEEGRLTSRQVFGALLSQSGKLRQEFAQIEPTVAGSLTGVSNELKLLTAEVLETAGSADIMTASLSGTASAIRGLTRLTSNVRSFFGSIRDEITQTVNESEALDSFVHSFLSLTEIGRVIAAQRRAALNDFTRGGGPRRGGRRGDEAEAVDTLTQIKIDARRIELNADQEYFAQLNELTRTSTERQVASYAGLIATIQTLRDEHQITLKQFRERRAAALDGLLPENFFDPQTGLSAAIDIQSIRELYAPIKQETTELSEFMKGVWRGTGESIRSTLSDAFYEGELSIRSFVNVARRAVADILSALVTSGIKDAVSGLFSKSSTSGDALSTFFGLAVGNKAGGGLFDGPTIVGEDGPELVTGRGRVMNARQMAFAGAGSKINYAPTFQLNIQSDGNEESERRMAEYMESRLAQDKQEFVRVLGRSGVEVKG